MFLRYLEILRTDVVNSPYFIGLIVLIILDFILGTFRSLIAKDLNSSVGLKGLIKHSSVFIIVVIVNEICYVSGYPEMATAFTLFYIWEYAISIVENLAILNIPLPEWVLVRLTDLERKINRK